MESKDTKEELMKDIIYYMRKLGEDDLAAMKIVAKNLYRAQGR